ncbi:UNVERIFIED_CONTAM: Fatty acyl-CoA reductase 3 [Sesamum latifolium]|uniref:Fatty acyl-CoA reductase n=1 Tax=Sesamum latifolium TaxID=2727402 RepID=A0AAW2Y5A8_9LAMI
MEDTQIFEYFESKTIFITGATGFLAKIFAEKILRVQPNIKKLFLLIRATTKTTSEQRLREEVVDAELFRVLREEYGASFDTALLSKIIPVSGDVSLENLGIVDQEVSENMWREIDIIVNSAATTRFDERYDVALRINALGAFHVRNFATKCSKLEMLLHVSTVFVEKILRVQPNIKKLFLLIRATSKRTSEQRLHEEVVNSELFRVLREEYGADLDSATLFKVIPVSGDISLENLGIVDSGVSENMWQEIDIIVNSAATTKFDERYDVALGINALGALHVGNFASKCSKLEMLLHVSTGLIPEKPFSMGETLDGSKISYLDINEEKKIMEEKLRWLQTQNATDKEITKAMKDLGIERTLDSIFVPYGQGKLKFFVGDPDSILDMIPGDMVANCMLAAIASHSNDHRRGLSIYHVGSSRRNPLKLEELKWLMHRYLTENPMLDTRGKPIRVGQPTTLNTMASFHNYIATHYLPFLKILELVNMIVCNYFESLYISMRRRINYVMRLTELYKPYVFFQGIFDDANTENLRMMIKGSNTKALLNFDPKCIQWDEYFENTHFKGLIKYVLK